LYKEEFHDVYFSSGVVKVVKARRLKFSRYITSMWEQQLHV